MKITKEMIEACQKAGACKAGLKWISIKPRTIEQLWEKNNKWFFWLENILSKPAREAYYAAAKTACEAEAYNAAVETALIKALKMDGWK